VIRGAVLGYPIKHSLSPILHKAAFEFLGIEGSYSAIEVPSGSLETFLDNRGSEFDYLSLTMPLKEEVLTLDVDIDSRTERIRSGNTLLKSGSRWSLTSTDGSGLISAIERAGLNAMESVLVLGAGGTARACVGALDSAGRSIDVLGRSSTRQEGLESSIQDSDFSYLRWGAEINFNAYDLVINTTPAGAADLLAEAVPSKVSAVLFDVIYKPWPTVLATKWQNSSGRVLNGLELLLYQGIDQLELVLDKDLDHAKLADHLRPILQRAAQ